ncbi:hypothetical protein SNEBB_002191 [Seison nebaliae]|nr:hypothetical protein SNEBB_002191 [Seison nebaliae]
MGKNRRLARRLPPIDDSCDDEVADILKKDRPKSYLDMKTKDSYNMNLYRTAEPYPENDSKQIVLHSKSQNRHQSLVLPSTYNVWSNDQFQQLLDDTGNNLRNLSNLQNIQQRNFIKQQQLILSATEFHQSDYHDRLVKDIEPKSKPIIQPMDSRTVVTLEELDNRKRIQVELADLNRFGNFLPSDNISNDGIQEFDDSSDISTSYRKAGKRFPASDNTDKTDEFNRVHNLIGHHDDGDVKSVTTKASDIDVKNTDDGEVIPPPPVIQVPEENGDNERLNDAVSRHTDNDESIHDNVEGDDDGISLHSTIPSIPENERSEEPNKDLDDEQEPKPSGENDIINEELNKNDDETDPKTLHDDLNDHKIISSDDEGYSDDDSYYNNGLKDKVEEEEEEKPTGIKRFLPRFGRKKKVAKEEPKEEPMPGEKPEGNAFTRFFRRFRRKKD